MEQKLVRVDKHVYKQVLRKMGLKSFNKCVKGMLISCYDYDPPETDTEMAQLFNQLKYSIKPLAERITALEERCR